MDGGAFGAPRLLTINFIRKVRPGTQKQADMKTRRFDSLCLGQLIVEMSTIKSGSSMWFRVAPVSAKLPQVFQGVCCRQGFPVVRCNRLVAPGSAWKLTPMGPALLGPWTPPGNVYHLVAHGFLLVPLGCANFVWPTVGPLRDVPQGRPKRS